MNELQGWSVSLESPRCPQIGIAVDWFASRKFPPAASGCCMRILRHLPHMRPAIKATPHPQEPKLGICVSQPSPKPQTLCKPLAWCTGVFLLLLASCCCDTGYFGAGAGPCKIQEQKCQLGLSSCVCKLSRHRLYSGGSPPAQGGWHNSRTQFGCAPSLIAAERLRVIYLFFPPKVCSYSLGYKFLSIYLSKAPLLCCVWAVSGCLEHLGQSQILFLSLVLAASYPGPSALCLAYK